jgi:hypothetical protein
MPTCSQSWRIDRLSLRILILNHGWSAMSLKLSKQRGTLSCSRSYGSVNVKGKSNWILYSIQEKLCVRGRAESFGLITSIEGCSRVCCCCHLSILLFPLFGLFKHFPSESDTSGLRNRQVVMTSKTCDLSSLAEWRHSKQSLSCRVSSV